MRRIVLVLLALLSLSACAADDGRYDTSESSLRRCATSSTSIEGVDVSHHNGTIDWNRVEAAGVRFAFIRVSDALYEDTQFDRNWSEAARVGILRGAYQYFRPNKDVNAQADLLIERMGTLEANDLPPVIDVEYDGSLAPSVVAQRVRQWIDRVQAATGRTPIIYTAYYFWRDEVGNADPQGSPLWIANYGVTCPLVPDAWSRWTFHQYSESGTVAGISGDVDRDVFDGTEAELLALTAATGSTTPERIAIGFSWTRNASGSYDFTATAPESIARVDYYVQDYRIASATRGTGNYAARYARFNVATVGREFEVRGFDASGNEIGHGIGSIDSVSGPAVYVRQVAAGEYEIGLERPNTGAVAIEVSADGWLLTDSVSGSSHTGRMAVRSTFSLLGSRTFELRTYNADGSYRGAFRRTVVLE